MENGCGHCYPDDIIASFQTSLPNRRASAIVLQATISAYLITSARINPLPGRCGLPSLLPERSVP